MRRLTEFPEVFAALDQRLERHKPAPIALALSGGGDSMALLHMADHWARRNGRRLLVLTVDHGLHPESAAWTRFAGAAAKSLGADWRALRWIGDKPNTGLPAAARRARHRLLAEAAREGGASVILFAHTADDAAEGDLMRAADAPTLGRLRGWSPSPIWPEGRDIFILRPLLHARRAALRTWLRAEGLPWLDDPANDDGRYARPRARRTLAASGEAVSAGGDGVGNTGGLGELTRSNQATADGRLILARTALVGLGEETARRFLAMAMVCASGAAAPPRGAALQRLTDRLRASSPLVATLGGARVTADASTLSFARESGELRRSMAQPLHLAAGQTAVWDGRFEITADAALTIDALAGSAARLSKGDRARLGAVPAAVRPSLPALFNGNEVSLPRPFGDGRAHARALAGPRLSAACGLIAHERDISPSAVAQGMAQGEQSSYVEALTLA